MMGVEPPPAAQAAPVLTPFPTQLLTLLSVFFVARPLPVCYFDPMVCAASVICVSHHARGRGCAMGGSALSLLLAECDICSLVHPRIHYSDLEEGEAGLAEAVASLTPQEYEVFVRMAAGRSNRQLAAEMYLTEFTIKAHLTKIKGKLGATSRVQLALAASIWNAWSCLRA